MTLAYCTTAMGQTVRPSGCQPRPPAWLTGRRHVPASQTDGSRRTPPMRAPREPASTRATSGEVSDFARFVQAEGGPQQRLQRGVELVVDLVDGCDHAGVTIAQGRRLMTPAASDDIVRSGDRWQEELNQGPCLDSVRLEHTVMSVDLAHEERWPRWAARARADLGISAMLSVLLFTEHDTWGALNLYADRSGAWSDDDIDTAHGLAGHLAVSLADAHEVAQRGRAMLTRTTIGQAQGILMERYGIDADQAFAYLRRISQSHQRKLVDLAADLIAGRQLPDPGAGSAEA